MNRRMATIGVLMAVLLTSLPARADFTFGLGASGHFGVENKQLRLPDAWSVDGMLGYRLTLGIVEFTPELDLTYLRSTGSLSAHDVDWAFQAAVGGRIGVQISFVVPSVYALVGLGMLEVTSQDSGPPPEHWSLLRGGRGARLPSGGPCLAGSPGGLRLGEPLQRRSRPQERAGQQGPRRTAPELLPLGGLFAGRLRGG
ncbi:MAG: hypothetical protein QM765_08035 [Myxococcales bacterium]